MSNSEVVSNPPSVIGVNVFFTILMIFLIGFPVFSFLMHSETFIAYCISWFLCLISSYFLANILKNRDGYFSTEIIFLNLGFNIVFMVATSALFDIPLQNNIDREFLENNHLSQYWSNMPEIVPLNTINVAYAILKKDGSVDIAPTIAANKLNYCLRQSEFYKNADNYFTIHYRFYYSYITPTASEAQTMKDTIESCKAEILTELKMQNKLPDSVKDSLMALN